MTGTERYRIKIIQQNGCNSWLEWLEKKKALQADKYKQEPWRLSSKLYYERVSKNNPAYLESQRERNKLRYTGKTIAKKVKPTVVEVVSPFTFEFINQQQLDVIMGCAASNSCA